MKLERQLNVEGVKRLLELSYDRIAPKYYRERGSKGGWQLRELKRFMRLLPPGGRVLDMGCGTGPVQKAAAQARFPSDGDRPVGEDGGLFTAGGAAGEGIPPEHGPAGIQGGEFRRDSEPVRDNPRPPPRPLSRYSGRCAACSSPGERS